jgi:two-component system alkaline phosphatase synthesis response regulator PhoP
MSKKKILVIDDEKSIRDMIKNTLSLSGYQVETAADGQLGFEKAVTDYLDLVLIYIKMPKFNGL